jgi:hypothetical protein
LIGGGVTSLDAEDILSPDAGFISNLDLEVISEVILATAKFHNMDMGEMVRDRVDTRVGEMDEMLRVRDGTRVGDNIKGGMARV